MHQEIGLYSVGTSCLPGLGAVRMVTFAEITHGSPEHLSWVSEGALAQNRRSLQRYKGERCGVGGEGDRGVRVWVALCG